MHLEYTNPKQQQLTFSYSTKLKKREREREREREKKKERPSNNSIKIHIKKLETGKPKSERVFTNLFILCPQLRC
jgi:hypothetical protein